MKLDIIMWEVCILSDLGNKEIMSKNLKRYIELSGKDRKDIAKDLDVPYSTFTDWVNGNYYPGYDIRVMSSIISNIFIYFYTL